MITKDSNFVSIDYSNMLDGKVALRVSFMTIDGWYFVPTTAKSTKPADIQAALRKLADSITKIIEPKNA